jgi:hypothetical protein
MPRLTAADLAAWRRALEEEGDGEWFDPTVAQAAMPLLMAEVEALWREADAVRLSTLRDVAQLLDRRLGEVALRGALGADGLGCPHCHDAMARRLAVAVRERAEGRAAAGPT